MKRVQIAELKSNLSALLREVEAGAAIEIVHRARPIARIVPLASPRETIVVLAARRSFRELRRKKYAPARWAISSLDLLNEERGER